MPVYIIKPLSDPDTYLLYISIISFKVLRGFNATQLKQINKIKNKISLLYLKKIQI